MDLNCITVMRVLRPLQAAHYLVTAYPSHCDALALRCAGAWAGVWARCRLWQRLLGLHRLAALAAAAHRAHCLPCPALPSPSHLQQQHAGQGTGP